MRLRISILAVTVGFLFSSTVFAVEPQTVASNITAVTVYGGEALITRAGTADTVAGAATLRLAGLPMGLNDASVRVELEGPEGTQFFGHEMRSAFAQEAASEEVAKLNAQYDALRDKKSKLKHRMASAELANGFLSSVRIAGAEQIGQALVTEPPVTAETLGVYDFLKAKNIENYETMESIEIEMRALNKEEAEIQKELGRLHSQSQPDTRELLVRYEASRAGKLSVRVSYILYGAFWEPVYDVRTDGNLERCEIAYQARLMQTTGEDWKDVLLTLSTAKPQLGASMPPLYPWYVGKNEPVRALAAPGEKEKRSAGKMALMAQIEEAADAAAPVPAILPTATVGVHGTHVTFTATGTASIASDGEPHKVPIAVRSFSFVPQYVTTPRLSPAVYIRTDIKNDSDLTFLAGPAFIFRGNDFIGEGRISETAPGGVLEDIYLGADERIRVKFHTLKEFSNDNISFGTQMAKERKYKIDLKSTHEKRVTIEVWDQQPVTKDEDIKVETFDVSPKPETDLKPEEASQGFLKWKIELDPGAEKSIQLGFRVKYKKDTDVYGI